MALTYRIQEALSTQRAEISNKLSDNLSDINEVDFELRKLDRDKRMLEQEYVHVRPLVVDPTN